jgi:hypothetical protein
MMETEFRIGVNLMMEAELVSETLVFDLTLTRLIAREDSITFMRREHFKSYTVNVTVITRLCKERQRTASEVRMQGASLYYMDTQHLCY